MTSKLLVFIFCLSISQSIFAQEVLISEKINDFFVALNSKNHQAIDNLIADEVQLVSLSIKSTEEKLSFENKTDFIQAITEIPNEIQIREEIKNLKIQINEDIAFASMKYDFYVNEELSHSGINYFNLIKIKNQWQIIHILDSRYY